MNPYSHLSIPALVRELWQNDGYAQWLDECAVERARLREPDGPAVQWWNKIRERLAMKHGRHED